MGDQGRVSGLLDVLSMGSLSNFRGGARQKDGRLSLVDSKASGTTRGGTTQSKTRIKGQVSQTSVTLVSRTMIAHR